MKPLSQLFWVDYINHFFFHSTLVKDISSVKLSNIISFLIVPSKFVRPTFVLVAPLTTILSFLLIGTLIDVCCTCSNRFHLSPSLYPHLGVIFNFLRMYSFLILFFNALLLIHLNILTSVHIFWTYFLTV